MRSRWVTAITLATIAGLGPAQAASAQGRPYVSSPPTISGSAIVGSTLTSSGGQAGGPPGTTVGRAWLRCTSSTDESKCSLINGALDTSTYKLTGDDRGRYMRSALYAYRDYPRDLVYRMSPATAAVANPAPAATPTPVPTPAPPVAQPTPTPAPVQPVPQPLPTEQAAPPTAAAPSTPAKRMRPFPTVRISGVLTPNGAQISLLTVKAPKAARITVNCAGRCPQRRIVRAAKGKQLHLRPLETYLRAGVKLTITISKPGYISKVTTIEIRKAKAPLRSDLCRVPGATKRSRCPK
jgi:hypothetical protein